MRAWTGDETLRLSASFGVADSSVAGAPDELIEKADEALYLAKQGGRDRVEVTGQGQNAECSIA
jgi:PleD family two-component response regulator